MAGYYDRWVAGSDLVQVRDPVGFISAVGVSAVQTWTPGKIMTPPKTAFSEGSHR